MLHRFKSVPRSGESSQPGKAARGQFLILNLLIALVLTSLPATAQMALAATTLAGTIGRIEQGYSGAMMKANLVAHRKFAAVLAKFPDLAAIDPDNDHPLLGLVKGGSRMLTSIIGKRRNTEAQLANPSNIITIGIR